MATCTTSPCWPWSARALPFPGCGTLRGQRQRICCRTALAAKSHGPHRQTFAQYVVADGAFATAPFLHTAGQLGLRVVARLKGNLPELSQAAARLFDGQPPHSVFPYGADRVELWDADDFPPWATLRWERVRVLRYRQHKPDGTVIQAEWLTDFPRRQVGSFNLFRLARTVGRSKTRASTMGRTATAWSTSATTIPTACC